MWEISELLERIEREKRAAAVRSMIISLILGGACILIGLCWWERLVAPWPVSWQVWAVLSVAVLLPLLSTGADWLGRWWGGLPRCPECGARLRHLLPVLRRCPECRRVIISDRRTFLPGYVPPVSESWKSFDGNTVGDFVGQWVVGLVVVLFPALILFGIVHQVGMANLPRLTAASLVWLGGLVIFYNWCGRSGMKKLKTMVLWIDRKCDRLNRKIIPNYRSRLPDPAHLCPHCRREPDHVLAAVTGHCSHCGGPILQVAEEADSPAMMNGRNIRRYRKIRRFALLMLVWLLGVWLSCLLRRDGREWVMGCGVMIAGLLICGGLWQLRREWRLRFRCPFCQYPNDPEGILGQTGHCAGCFRKLVRDEAPETERSDMEK